ncbi:AMP-binding protein [Streptomyces mirabilis]|uniref:AMP-binding protein n=1 Tax=Streptomyces mirabilis TaxID=68239 RepID=UPI00344A0808
MPVSAHEQLRARPIAHVVDHAEANLAITTDRLTERLRDCLPQQRVVTPRDLAQAHRTASAVRPRAIGLELARLSYTSGSTGTAKGIMLSHDNILARANIVADYLELTPQDHTLALMPFSFDYVLNRVLATFQAGGAVVVRRSAFAPDIFGTPPAHDVTGLAGVPGLWSDLLLPGSPFVAVRYLSLRCLTHTGSALTPPTAKAIRSAHPQLAVFATYGLTEAFCSTYLHPDRLEQKPTSVGRAIPDCQVHVLAVQGTPAVTSSAWPSAAPTSPSTAPRSPPPLRRPRAPVRTRHPCGDRRAVVGRHRDLPDHRDHQRLRSRSATT